MIGGYWGKYLNKEAKNNLHGEDNLNAKNLFKLDVKKGSKELYLDGAEFCPCVKINDGRRSGVGINCRYVQAKELVLLNPGYISVQATRDISNGEELYADYGSIYWSEIF